MSIAKYLFKSPEKYSDSECEIKQIKTKKRDQC